jgi:hypothetical protein
MLPLRIFSGKDLFLLLISNTVVHKNSRMSEIENIIL